MADSNRKVLLFFFEIMIATGKYYGGIRLSAL
jgi:hypothetical protein